MAASPVPRSTTLVGSGTGLWNTKSERGDRAADVDYQSACSRVEEDRQREIGGETTTGRVGAGIGCGRKYRTVVRQCSRYRARVKVPMGATSVSKDKHCGATYPRRWWSAGETLPGSVAPDSPHPESVRGKQIDDAGKGRLARMFADEVCLEVGAHPLA